MNRGRIASIAIVSVLLLSACSLPGASRTSSTQINQTATPANNGAGAGTTVAATPADNSVMPAGGDVITTTPEITSTTDLTPTTEVTTTTGITPTTEVTPSTTTTVTTDTTQSGGVTVNQTAVKSLVTRVRLNMRSGPGMTYKIIARLVARRTIKVNGISDDGNWYRVLCLNGAEGDCWISASPSYVTAKK
jgi:uncharacterized protein YgiM (DUF1202 family)